MRFWACCCALTILALAAILAGCASGRGGGRGIFSQSESADADLLRRAKAHALFSEAVRLDLNDQPAEATEKLDAAFRLDSSDPRLALDLARRYERMTNYDRAIEVLKLTSAQVEPSEFIYARLGAIYSVLGKTNQAVQANENAIRANPRSVIGYQNLYWLLLRGGKPDEALHVLNRAAAVADPPPDFLADLAELYTSFGRQVPVKVSDCRRQSLQLLEKAADLQPTNELVILKVADGFYLFEQWSKAQTLYEQLVGSEVLSSLYRESLRAKLTAIYLRTGQREKSVEQLRGMVADDPSNVRVYLQLSQLAYEDKKLAEAAEYLRKALLFRPDAEGSYYDLAGLQLDADDARGALDTLDRARTRFSRNFRGEYLAALVYTQLKDYAEALRSFTSAEVIAKAMETNLLNHVFYFQLGAASERSGDLRMAEQHFQKSLALSPDFASALNYLGYMWANRGEHLEQAREMIERAVKQEPENEAYLDSLGWVLFQQGKSAEALEWLLKADRLQKETDAEMQDHLGDVFFKLGQVDKAVEAWKKSLAIQPNDVIHKKIEAAGKK